MSPSKKAASVEVDGGASIEQQLFPGDQAQVYGLTSVEGKKMNSMLVEIVKYNNKAQRYAVRLLMEEGKSESVPPKADSLIKGSNLILKKAAVREHPTAAVEDHVEVFEGYPTEQLIDVFSDPSKTLSPGAKELKKLRQHLPLLFPWVRPASADAPEKPMMVDEATFHAQWEAFSYSFLSNFDFDNVLIAGGAILACLLPPNPKYARLKPSNWKMEFCDYNFIDFEGIQIDATTPNRSLSQYMQEVRWPESDVDMFIYGLTSAEADEKLQAILKSVRIAALLPGLTTKQKEDGNVLVKFDAYVTSCLIYRTSVLFVKTPNTITIVTPNRRKFQIVLRIYETKEQILNSFDIDCCCVGYDGKKVYVTPRACTAITRRINPINLSIRGKAYENRLLRYIIYSDLKYLLHAE